MNQYTSPLQGAVAYAQSGYRVIWAPSGSKFPTVQGWQDKATNNLTEVITWFTVNPAANLCIATGEESGIFVLDVDDKKDKEGSKTLAALEDKYGQLPDTHSVATGSGGMHYYFSWVGVDFDLRNSAGKLGKDLDTRGNGGQVVAPPSRANDPDHFQPYQIVDTRKPVPAPAWLLDMLRPPKPAAPQRSGDEDPFSRPGGFGALGDFTALGASAFESAKNNIKNAADGTQNHTINVEAHGMGGLFLSGQLGGDPDKIKQGLLDAALEGNHPEHRARRTIESGWTTARPRTITDKPKMIVNTGRNQK